MNESLLNLEVVEKQANAVVETLKEKMFHFGYQNITYRLESLVMDEISIDILGFSFWNEQGQRITPGFFKYPECFEKPFDTVERFADFVVHLVLNEIGIRLNRNVDYYYAVGQKFYKAEEISNVLLENASLASHRIPLEKAEDGLYGCSDGLWLFEKGTIQKMTLFDICSPDEMH